MPDTHRTGLGLALLLAVMLGVACENPNDRYLRVLPMKRSLRGLMNAQEAFFADSLRYASSLASLRGALGQHALDSLELPSDSVSIDIEISGSGYVATAHRPGTRTACKVFVGSENAPRVPGAAEGQVSCP